MPRGRRGNHEGSIRKRSDGRWEASYRIGGDRRYITGRVGETRASVAEKLAEAISREHFGMSYLAYRESYASFLDSWLDRIKLSVRPKTFESYSDTVRLRIKPAIGHVILRRLQPEDVEDAMKAAADAGLSIRTVAYVRSTIRRSLRDAQRRGRIHINVAELVDPPHVPKKEIAIPQAVDFKAFVKAARKNEYEPMILLFAILAGRRGEVLGLRWSDVDDDGNVRIQRSLQRIRTEERRGKGWVNVLQLLEVKTSTSRRALKLPKVILAALTRYKKRQDGWRKKYRKFWSHEWPEDLMFSTRIGTPIHPDNVKRMLKPVLDEAGLGHRTIHELRHIAISNMLKAGVRLEVVSPIAGHASIRTTKDVYGHIVPPMMDDAAEKMDAIARGTA